MAADLQVGLFAKKHELSVGRPELGLSAGHPMGQVKKNEQVDEGDNEDFTPGLCLLVGPEGQKVGSSPKGDVHRGHEGFAVDPGVGVEKEHELTLGGLGQLMACPSLSRPTCGQIPAFQTADSGVPAGVLLDQLSGTVLRMVVQNENLEVRVVALRDAIQAWGEPVFLIAGRDKDRE